MGLWQRFLKPSESQYRIDKVVASRSIVDATASKTHIICDIDKTYLETEFESLLRMAKIAFEQAQDKITVPGASDVLYLARWGSFPPHEHAITPNGLHFVSSSPPQLRTVLEEKLLLDGLDWNSDTFKNQAYNLRMGRSDLLRHHVAYKSMAILRKVIDAPKGTRFFMIGDNAESDGFIYGGLKFLLSGHLSSDGYRAYLETAGVERSLSRDLKKMADELLERKLEQTVPVILIRNVPRYKNIVSPTLTDFLFNFSSYYEASLLLILHNLIHPKYLWMLTMKFHNVYRRSIRELDKALDLMNIFVNAHPSLVAHRDEILTEIEATRKKLAEVQVLSGIKIDDGPSSMALELRDLHFPHGDLPMLDEMVLIRAGRTLWVNLHMASRK